ncbi:unnamed protein product [Tetraodon nigroviridis]|nr:unnamed protein product [Tetraodon nigroviridis]
MMGAEESRQEKKQDTQREDQHQQSSAPAASPDGAGELPQCLLGDRSVDDMRFMITCTNWY